MEYNPFQHQDQTNSEALHAQEYTHELLLHPDFGKKIKTKKMDLHMYQPFQLSGQKGKQTFHFFRQNHNSQGVVCFFVHRS